MLLKADSRQEISEHDRKNLYEYAWEQVAENTRERAGFMPDFVLWE